MAEESGEPLRPARSAAGVGGKRFRAVVQKEIGDRVWASLADERLKAHGGIFELLFATCDLKSLGDALAKHVRIVAALSYAGADFDHLRDAAIRRDAEFHEAAADMRAAVFALDSATDVAVMDLPE